VVVLLQSIIRVSHHLRQCISPIWYEQFVFLFYSS